MMKKLTISFIAIFTLCSFTPAFSISEKAKEPLQTESAEAQVLINRLEEIKTMDKSDMKSSQKRVLRKEVRSIKKTLTEMKGGGVYLSVGAIIIIVLLLILLL